MHKSLFLCLIISSGLSSRMEITRSKEMNMFLAHSNIPYLKIEKLRYKKFHFLPVPFTQTNYKLIR